MMDIDAIDAGLDRIDEGVREARAALAVMRDGDTTAMQDLDGVVDAIAAEVAQLKGQTSGTSL